MALNGLFVMLKSVFCMNEMTKKFLLIDNSNTRTKFMFAVDGKLQQLRLILPTKNITASELESLLRDYEFSCAVISSVVPSVAKIFEEVLSCPIHFVTYESPMELAFDYPAASSLGADRVANCMAAIEYGRFPCVVIDAGTAVTFDVVKCIDNKPTFCGGAISPGLSSYTSYLHQRTALLPQVDTTGSVYAIAQNTRDAIRSGAVLGFVGMVREIVNRIQEELGKTVHIVLTGGDAALIQRELYPDSIMVPNLTFHGLLQVANRL